MPTNEFQELVKLIEQSLYSKSAKVECPVFKQGQGLEDFSEVDILITDKFGPRTIKIAVEATDLGRPLGIGKFREFLAKYRGEGRVAVQDYYVVTRHGYTNDAKNRAILADVELITLDEAKTADWGKLIERPNGFVFETKPHICALGFEPTVPGITPEELLTKATLKCEHGHDFGLARNYFDKLFWNRIIKERPEYLTQLSEVAKNDPSGGGHLHLKGPPCHKFFFVLNGKEHPIENWWFQLHKNVRQGTVETRCYERVSTKEPTKRILHTKATAGDLTIETAMEIIREGGHLVPPPTVAMKLTNLPLPFGLRKQSAPAPAKQSTRKPRRKGKH